MFATACRQIFQLVGGYCVAHALNGVGQTCGASAIVIALLAWLYLEAQLVLVAAELNTVLKIEQRTGRHAAADPTASRRRS